MQSNLSRIWTLASDSLSSDDNPYAIHSLENKLLFYEIYLKIEKYYQKNYSFHFSRLNSQLKFLS